MMRRYHRWLSVFFGIFLLWISATGVLSHIGEIANNGWQLENEAQERAERGEAPKADPAMPPGFTCPETMTCRPKRVPKPGEWNVGYLHHLHSGEEFGEAGKIISILSGLALLFFSFSGLYMYVQMARGRMVKVDRGGKVRGGRFFWK